MQRLLLTMWIVLSLLVQHGLAHAQSDALEARVRALLASGVEESVTPQTLAKLGPKVPEALRAAFEDTSEPRYLRLRALSMLSHYQGAQVTAWFVRLLNAGVEPLRAPASDALHPSRSPLVLRRTIVRLAGRKLAQLERPLTLVLAHRNAQVRREAVLALVQFDTVSARKALSSLRERENSPLVIEALTDRSVRSRALPPSDPKSAKPLR